MFHVTTYKFPVDVTDASAKSTLLALQAGLKGTTRDNYGRLVLGDIIVSVDGKPTKTGSDLYKILDKYKIGQTLDIECLRTASKEHLAVTLEPSVPLQVQAMLTVEPMANNKPTNHSGGVQPAASSEGYVCANAIPDGPMSCASNSLQAVVPPPSSWT